MTTWSEIVGRANDAVLDTWGDPDNLWTYSPKTGGSYTLDGILERAPELVDLQGNVQQAGDEWTFDYKAEDLSISPAQGDQLSRTGELYEVIHIENDNEGMPRLRLVKLT